MDFIPNHTSDKHNWFQQSLLGGADNPYSDYYIWSDGKLDADGQRQPPNNWVALLDKQENPFYFNTPSTKLISIVYSLNKGQKK